MEKQNEKKASECTTIVILKEEIEYDKQELPLTKRDLVPSWILKGEKCNCCDGIFEDSFAVAVEADNEDIYFFHTKCFHDRLIY